MAKIKKSESDKPARVHCPDCCYYVDGAKLFRFPIPGMQHHRISVGTLHEKIGTTTPCTCAAGDEVERGFHHDPDGRPTRSANETFGAFFKTTRIEARRSDVPMPMDNF